MQRRMILVLVILMLAAASASAFAGTVQLPQTGQTKCYRGVSPYDEISCAGTVKDGEIRAGAPLPAANQRFVVNGDCVTDNLTGLMWTRNGNLYGQVHWYSAIDNANNLTLCGYSDWRLPNLTELESLVNADISNIAAWLNTQGFYNVQSSYYWSSTSYAYGTDYAWIVYMWYGYVDYSNKDYGYNYVWPVRSGQVGGSFGSSVIVSPESGSWTSSPQNISVSSSGATTIYYRMINTYDGSTPADPSDPTPSSNDGSIGGPGGAFVYYGNGGQLKKTKLKFVGCDSSGCGPVSSVLSYTMDLRNTAGGHVSVSNLSVLPDPVTPGQNFTVNFSMAETLGYAESFQNISVAILRSDDQLVFDCKIYDNVTINANQTWSDTPACQLYTTSPTGTYKAIIRGKHTGGNWFDFDTTGGGTNPVTFQAITNNPQTVSISGKVRDMNNSSVSGAVVKLMSSTDALLSQSVTLRYRKTNSFTASAFS